MLKAMSANLPVLAHQAQKGDVFQCPKCGEPVTLKAGRIVTPHFAHASGSPCSWGAEESKEHRRAKILIAERFGGAGYEVDIEHVLLSGERRADVFLRNPQGDAVAVEIQKSSIQLEEIQERAFSYAAMGVAQFWLPLISSSDVERGTPFEGGYRIEKFHLRPFQKWVRGLAFGHDIWFLDAETEVAWKATVAPHQLFKEPRTIYTEGGGEDEVAGYHYPSKKWVELTLRGPFSLSHLRLVTWPRHKFSTKQSSWPACRVAGFSPAST
jgi:hypothetical protein